MGTATENGRTFARQAVKERGDWLLDELAALKRRPQDESIHDTRVQSRRMRAALVMFRDRCPQPSWQALYDLIRRITRILGEARETEAMIALLRGLTVGGDTSENVCREYLEERLQKKLKKLKAGMHRDLRDLDLRLLRSKITDLLAGFDRPHTGDEIGNELQRGRDVLAETAGPVLGFRPRYQFARASDQRLHQLRIAAKKLRYIMEILDPVWPGGLKDGIAAARTLQDAAGVHQDWAVLRIFLQDQIRRLMRQRRAYLAFQVGRLLATAEDRKAGFRARMLPAIHGTQSALRRQLDSPPGESSAPAARQAGEVQA